MVRNGIRLLPLEFQFHGPCQINRLKLLFTCWARMPRKYFVLCIENPMFSEACYEVSGRDGNRTRTRKYNHQRNISGSPSFYATAWSLWLYHYSHFPFLCIPCRWNILILPLWSRCYYHSHCKGSGILISLTQVIKLVNRTEIWTQKVEPRDHCVPTF